MPYQTKITSAPMLSHACPVPGCNRPTRPDGYCRRRGCPNEVPDDIIRPAREAALAEMRHMLATARRNRQIREDTTP